MGKKHRIVFEIEDLEGLQGGAKVSMWVEAETETNTWKDIGMSECTSSGTMALYSRLSDALKEGRADGSGAVNEARKWLYVAALGVFPAVLKTFFDGTLEGRSYSEMFEVVASREDEFREMIQHMIEKESDRPPVINSALRYLLETEDPVRAWLNVLQRAVMTTSGRAALTAAGVELPQCDEDFEDLDEEDEDAAYGPYESSEGETEHKPVTTADGAQVKIVGWDFSSLKKE